MKLDNNYKFEPEKLSLWDRFFNRRRKIVIEEGREGWCNYRRDEFSINVHEIRYMREFVKYAIVDRLTGSVTLKKDYLD